MIPRLIDGGHSGGSPPTPIDLADVRDVGLVVGLATVGALKWIAALTDPMIDLRSGWSHAAIWIVGSLELIAAALLFHAWKVGLHQFARVVQGAILSLFLLGTLWRSSFPTERACPCFGSIDIPTIYVAPVLLLLLGTLWVDLRGSHHSSLRSETRQWAQRLAARSGLIAPVVLGLLSIGPLLSPTVRGTCLRLAGMKSVDSDPVDVSGWEAGKRHTVVATLRNSASNPIEVVGSKSSCHCVSVGDCRFTIRGQSAGTVSMEFVGAEAGPFRQRITFFLLNGTRQQTVDVEICGWLISKGEK